MKKQVKNNLKNVKSSAKSNLEEISSELGITVPENLKDFNENKMLENEVVNSLTSHNNGEEQKGIIHSNKHTNNHTNITYCPPQTQIPCSHTNTGHSNHSNSDTYIDHGK
ncbi:hypothetical protein TRIP_D80006 [uncultured Paludibacter sp.]|uniref:Uncharacterized protein n=1 Tax=uncultured Paludibacter sp. TaxID=497635 RepID=A0A653AKX2_9BACT|nr:hypothetical protein TRIP_D80006 [uncultured Paludibacter sp.]